MKNSKLRKLAAASVATMIISNVLAPLTPSGIYRGQVVHALERQSFRVNQIEEVPYFVLANPELFEFQVHEITEEVPGSRQQTTDRELAASFAPNFIEIEPEMEATFVITENREAATSMEEVPYWVLANPERYGFSDDTVTISRDVVEEVFTDERLSTENPSEVPAHVVANPERYNFRREFVENRELPNTRMVTNNREIAESHAPNFEVLPSLVDTEPERVFSTNRVGGVLEGAIPDYVRTDARFDLRQSGEFQWGQVQHSAVHPGNQPNILSREITLPEVSLPTIPAIGDIVTHGGHSWQVVGTETYTFYGENHDGSHDWVGPWTGGFASVRGTALGWNGTIRNVNNPNLTLTNSTTAQQAQNGGMWRIPIVEGTHFRRGAQGQILPPTGNTWSGPLAPAPGHTVSPAARQAIVNHGALYMTFSITGNGQVQWHKFVPLITSESTFDLQRFEYQNGTPLWHWLDSEIIQNEVVTPQYAFWQAERIYAYSWDEVKQDTRVETTTYPKFSWYTRALSEVTIPQFEFWETTTHTEYSWVLTTEMDVNEPVSPDQEIETPTEDEPNEEESPSTTSPEDEPTQEEIPNIPAPELETPSIPTPEVEAPVEEAPSTPTPEVEAPTEEAPTTQTPELETPTEEAPSTPTPEVEAPTEEAPTTPTPEVETPTEEAPTIQTPELETPTEEAPTTPTPEVETPSEETPNTPTPEVEAPIEEAPSTPAPEIESPVGETPDTSSPEPETPQVEVPSNPETPERPAKPVRPTLPERPTKPVRPTLPERPTKPVLPTLPGRPTKPTLPVLPDCPKLGIPNLPDCPKLEMLRHKLDCPTLQNKWSTPANRLFRTNLTDDCPHEFQAVNLIRKFK